jgi:DNA-nicking Smr family endonuclease
MSRASRRKSHSTDSRPRDWSYTPFESLALKGASGKKTSLRINRPDGRTDEEAFLEAMADVREIREFRQLPAKASPKLKPRRGACDDTIEVLGQIVSGKRKIRLSDTAEYMEWVGRGVRKDTPGRLHRGEFAVQDFLDLHGMSLEEAREAFGEFIRGARMRGLFCVKVIHGRGLRSREGPVLKEALKGWLHGPFRRLVAAYATARDCDGGLGATYILLKGP